MAGMRDAIWPHALLVVLVLCAAVAVAEEGAHRARLLAPVHVAGTDTPSTCVAGFSARRYARNAVRAVLGKKLARQILSETLTPVSTRNVDRDFGLEALIDQLLVHARPDARGHVVRVRARPGWNLGRAFIVLRAGETLSGVLTIIHVDRFSSNPDWYPIMGEVVRAVDDALRDVLRAQEGDTPRAVTLHVERRTVEEYTVRVPAHATRGDVIDASLAQCEEANVSWHPKLVDELCACAHCDVLTTPVATPPPPPPAPVGGVRWEKRDQGGVTVILTQYKREYLQAQIHAIRRQTIPVAHIFVWQNGEHVDIGDVCSAYADVECVRSSHNFKFHGRFALGLLATTEYVAVFDDDSIPYSRWLENAMRASREHHAIAGAVGMTASFGDRGRWDWSTLPPAIAPDTSLMDGYWFGAHGEGPGYYFFISTLPTDRTVDLVGHAWFLRTEWLTLLWRQLPHTFDNGEDIALCASAKMHANVSCVVPAQPLWDLSQNGDVAFRLNMDAHATSGSKGHDYVRLQIADVWRALGWRTIEDSMGLPDTPAPLANSLATTPFD